LVLNLLDNAEIPGRRTVVLRVRPAAGGAEIEVQDTGVGMTAEVARTSSIGSTGPIRRDRRSRPAPVLA
jgi:hypothetical protein